MFQAIVDAATFQEPLDSVGVLVDESTTRLNEDGVTIRAMDPANVGMVHLEHSAAAFDSYEVNGDRMGVNQSRNAAIAGMANADQLITLDLDLPLQYPRTVPADEIPR